MLRRIRRDTSQMSDQRPDYEVGRFLQASRARITPEEAGITLYDHQRRVPGLRREELAMLAGVSASYYTRLEQGQSRNASPQILDALASALRLSDTERSHLHQLAHPVRRRRAPRPRPEKADVALLELLGGMDGVPAMVLGRRNDVLAWNPLGHALLAGHLNAGAPADVVTRANMTNLVFLDAETKALYADWTTKARVVVGNLRLTAAQYPDDMQLAEMIGTLSMRSPEFARLWSERRVQACDTSVFALEHPLVGGVTVTQQTLRSVGAPEQVLVTNTASPGSSSAEALRLLAQLTGDGRLPQADRAATSRPGSPRLLQ